VSRIVLDPNQLATTASQLQGAAGEYQAIGSRVASCNCGCMPADVAAVVDATTAMIRSQLDSVSAWLAADSADLAWRAGIPQDGSSAVGGVSGGNYMTVGGYAPPEFQLGAAADPSNVITIGGNNPADFGLGGAGSYISVGGYRPPEFDLGGNGGSSITIGGTWGYDPSTNPMVGLAQSSMTIGGTWGYDPSTNPMVGLAPSSMTIGGTWGYDPSTNPMVGLAPSSITIGGTPAGGIGGGGSIPINVGGLTGMNEPMGTLFGMAARNNDWFSFSMLQNIQAMQQRSAGIWTLPDGFAYKYSFI
jgi:hypothetical protein